MKKNDLVMQNIVFLWLAIATVIVLSIPLIMMQVSSEWDWKLPDFLIIGTLLFGMGSIFVPTARKINKKYWLTASILFLLAIHYIWAELAVGIFTNLGS